MTRETATKGAQIERAMANQRGAIPHAMDAKKKTLVAWPEGKE